MIRNLLIVDEGDPYNKILFNKSLNKIRSTGFFKNVESKIYESSDNSSKIIDIKVEEQPTGEISLGAGIGTNGTTVGGGIVEKNFLGKGIMLNTNLSISKFKTLANHANQKVVALGGINIKNIKKIKMLDCYGYASISYINNTYNNYKA